jgi:hypothetical protein
MQESENGSENRSENGSENPRVFISYSWDSQEHRLWVESFAGQLRASGIDARLDAWKDENQSIDDFMMVELERADFILAICTPEFHQKVIANAEGVQSTASGFEVGTAAALRRMGRKPIVPVLRRGEWTEAAPSNLLAYRYYDLTGDDIAEEFNKLRDHLLGYSKRAPDLGPRSGPSDSPELPDIFSGQSKSRAKDQARGGPPADSKPVVERQAAKAAPQAVGPASAAHPPNKSGKNKLLMIGGVVAAMVIGGWMLSGSGEPEDGQSEQGAYEEMSVQQSADDFSSPEQNPGDELLAEAGDEVQSMEDDSYPEWKLFTNIDDGYCYMRMQSGPGSVLKIGFYNLSFFIATFGNNIWDVIPDETYPFVYILDQNSTVNVQARGFDCTTSQVDEFSDPGAAMVLCEDLPGVIAWFDDSALIEEIENFNELKLSWGPDEETIAVYDLMGMPPVIDSLECEN